MKKLIFALLFALIHPVFAQIPDIRLETVSEGLKQPVHAVPLGKGPELLVVEQAGLIHIVTPGTPGKAVFLDIRDRVSSGGERGLLSVALHPDFAGNGRVFVNYTTKQNGQLESRISEFLAAPDRRSADPASESILLTQWQPYSNHNGGLSMFGPDGMLYIGFGDGGKYDDPHNAGQQLNTWLGKILRIAVSDTRGKYAVPPDNPFVATPDAKPEIYAYGLRNPWRFSFDRETRELYCGDVGQNAREEIDYIVKGGNYGWRIMEGFICTPGVNKDCDKSGLILPLVDYPRNDGVSVTGGFVYRGRKFPALQGVYLYADFATGQLWGLRTKDGKLTEHRVLLPKGPAIASFAEEVDGELLIVDYSGTLQRIAQK